MRVCTDLAMLQQALAEGPEALALVPTMGNLHQGHLQLVAEARRRAPRVAVSIYVNPLQFGPAEDFQSYPRTLDDDLAALASAGTDLVFVPRAEDVYPRGLLHHTRISVPDIGEILCGAFRPGHFTGVATVVQRLLAVTRARVAVFGKKDYQQLLIVRWLVQDLAIPVEIVGVETARDPDGLAMSSRNRYLSAAERRLAPMLYAELRRSAMAIERGAAPAQAEADARAVLAGEGWEPEYVSVRRRYDLAVPGPGDGALVILAAARLGGTRLIDNLEFDRRV